MALYLISDLHLEEERPELTRAFFRYLEELPEDAEALYILGDFFEVWVGDDHHSDFNLSVIAALKACTDSIPVFIMRGNRDFLYGEAFCQASGCTLIDDPSLIKYQDSQYLLMHGDSLCTQDEQYMAFRAQVRSEQWQQQVLSQTLEQRLALARQLRETSQQANSDKSTDIMDVTPEEVVRVMREHKVTALIHGHTHRPHRHDLEIDGQSGSRWVMGDWGNDGWQIRIDGDGPVLSKFSIEK